MLSSVTGLQRRACRMRCFIDFNTAQSVGRSWRAATIVALNSITWLKVGYLEPLSCFLENLQELNHIRNRFPFFVATPFIKQSKACKAPLNKLLINQQTIMYNKQFHLVGQSFFNVVICCRTGVADASME